MKIFTYEFAVKDESGALISTNEKVTIEGEDVNTALEAAIIKIRENSAPGWSAEYTGVVTEESQQPPIINGNGNQQTGIQFTFTFYVLKSGHIVRNQDVTIPSENETLALRKAVEDVAKYLKSDETAQYTGKFKKLIPEKK